MEKEEVGRLTKKTEHKNELEGQKLITYKRRRLTKTTEHKNELEGQKLITYKRRRLTKKTDGGHNLITYQRKRIRNVWTINEVSRDSDKLASNNLLVEVELNDEAKKIVSNVDVHDNVTLGRSVVACRKKLLVFDLNGVLVDISSYVPYDYDPDAILLKKAIFRRPYFDEFMRFCFERFEVGVWSSKTKFNMEPIIDFLFGDDKHKLLFIWDQSHCNYTSFKTVEKRYKPLILKKLKKLWEKFIPGLPWKTGEYNETNTLLIDDSPYKAICNPRHTAIFPYTYRFRHVGDNSLGPGGDLRVYLEGLATAENVQEYVKQNPFGQRAITEKNLSWGFYSKVIKACTSPPREPAEDNGF